jgi:hypothetical protein
MHTYGESLAVRFPNHRSERDNKQSEYSLFQPFNWSGARQNDRPLSMRRISPRRIKGADSSTKSPLHTHPSHLLCPAPLPALKLQDRVTRQSRLIWIILHTLILVTQRQDYRQASTRDLSSGLSSFRRTPAGLPRFSLAQLQKSPGHPLGQEHLQVMVPRNRYGQNPVPGNRI